MRCTKCGTEGISGKKFCAECGSPLSNRCENCGSENAPEAKFCVDCGNPLNPCVRTPVSASTSATSEHRLSAPASGVTTVYRWLELGNKAKSGPFREFWNAFLRAKGDFK